MNFISTFEELNKLYEEAKQHVKKDKKLEEPTEELGMKKTLKEAAEDEEIEIVDDEVAEEAEPRQMILECDKCGALMIKSEEDIATDEESGLVNVEEDCPFCEETVGYKIIGTMIPYEETEEEPAVEEEEPDVEEDTIEDDIIDEDLAEVACGEKGCKGEEDLEELLNFSVPVSVTANGNDVTVGGMS